MSFSSSMTKMIGCAMGSFSLVRSAAASSKATGRGIYGHAWTGGILRCFTTDAFVRYQAFLFVKSAYQVITILKVIRHRNVKKISNLYEQRTSVSGGPSMLETIIRKSFFSEFDRIDYTVVR
jgi:hypothetical protein